MDPLSSVEFLLRMAGNFEHEGNFAECIKSEESALLLREAEAEAVVAALQQRQSASKGRRPPPPSDVVLPETLSEQASSLVLRCNCYAVEEFGARRFDAAVFFLNKAMFLTEDGTENAVASSTWRRTLGTLEADSPQARIAPRCFFTGKAAEEQRLRLRAATLNNLGCMERRRGQLGASITFLRFAIQIESQLRRGNEGGVAGGGGTPPTYLNLCTVLSETGQHAEAVVACERAVALLQHELLTRSLGEKELLQTATMLVVALYNLGVSLQSRGRSGDAMAAEDIFRQAMETCRIYQVVPMEDSTTIEQVMDIIARRSRGHRSPRASGGAGRKPSKSDCSNSSTITPNGAQQQPKPEEARPTRRSSATMKAAYPTPQPPQADAISPSADEVEPWANQSHTFATPQLAPKPPSVPNFAFTAPTRLRGLSEADKPAPTPPAVTGTHPAAPPLHSSMSDLLRPPRMGPAVPPSLAPIQAPQPLSMSQSLESGTTRNRPAVPPFFSPPPPSSLRRSTIDGAPRLPIGSIGGTGAATTTNVAKSSPRGMSMADPPLPTASNPFGRRTYGSNSIGSGSLSQPSNAAISGAGGKSQPPRISIFGTGGPAAAGAGSTRQTSRVSSSQLPGAGTVASSVRSSRLPASSVVEERRRALLKTKRSQERAQQHRIRQQREDEAKADDDLATQLFARLLQEKGKKEMLQNKHAATQIQRIWRGVLARTWVAQMIAAAVRLQSVVRRFLVRAREERRLWEVEQARLRAERERRELAACRVLQFRIRQFIIRLRVLREYRAGQMRLFYAARRIQRAYRSFRVRSAQRLAAVAEANKREDEQRLFRQRVAARCIVRGYLRYKEQSAEVKAYQQRQRQHRAVVRIQAAVRGYLTRAWYSFYRVYRREQEMRSAAMQARLVIVQAACRVLNSMQYCQRRAVELQRARRNKQLHEAATHIQCMWRRHTAIIRRERLQAEHDRLSRRAGYIQRWYRTRVLRRRFLRWFDARLREKATRHIQRWLRGCWERRKAEAFALYHANLLRAQQLRRLQARSILVIQACCAAHASDHLLASIRRTFQRNSTAALLWQRVARGYDCRRDMALELYATRKAAAMEAEHRRKTAAVRVLQRAWRCAAAKDRVEQLRRERAAAAILVRAYRLYRARVALCDLREARQQRLEDVAARRLQRAVRGFLSAQRAREMDSYYRDRHNKKMYRLRREEAAVMIQTLWRGHVTRLALEGEKAEMQRLATYAQVIQHAWRDRRRRLSLTQEMAERVANRTMASRAALTIQCFWRKMAAAERVAQVAEAAKRRSAAALSLQSWWRMILAQREHRRRAVARREWEQLELHYAMLWEKNVTRINCYLRGRQSQHAVVQRRRGLLIGLLTEAERHRFLHRHEAATRIQALYRGHYERVYARGVRMEKEEAARQMAARVALERTAATRIQCCYRCYRARRLLAQLRMAERERIAASHEEYQERADPSDVVRELFWIHNAVQKRSTTKRQLREAARRGEAASTIQRAYRQWRARRQASLAAALHRQDAAAKLIQGYWRHHRDVFQVRDQQRRQAAAIRIQSYMRRWMVRKSWPAWRLAMEEERQERILVQEILDHAAIVLQCFWRKILACRVTQRLRTARSATQAQRELHEAAMVIQEAYRSHRQRQLSTHG